MSRTYTIQQQAKIVDMLDNGCTDTDLCNALSIDRRDVNEVRARHYEFIENVRTYRRKERDNVIKLDKETSSWNARKDEMQAALDKIAEGKYEDGLIATSRNHEQQKEWDNNKSVREESLKNTRPQQTERSRKTKNVAKKTTKKAKKKSNNKLK